MMYLTSFSGSQNKRNSGQNQHHNYYLLDLPVINKSGTQHPRSKPHGHEGHQQKCSLDRFRCKNAVIGVKDDPEGVLNNKYKTYIINETTDIKIIITLSEN